jgi:hypothetical protein
VTRHDEAVIGAEDFARRGIPSKAVKSENLKGGAEGPLMSPMALEPVPVGPGQ